MTVVMTNWTHRNVSIRTIFQKLVLIMEDNGWTRVCGQMMCDICLGRQTILHYRVRPGPLNSGDPGDRFEGIRTKASSFNALTIKSRSLIVALMVGEKRIPPVGAQAIRLVAVKLFKNIPALFSW